MRRARRRYGQMSLQETFSQIYTTNAWGGTPGSFVSGIGSTDGQAAQYAAMVREFIRAHGVRSVVDVGCGDFVIGRELQVEGVRYTGVDIVPALIERNQREFGKDGIEFKCLDVTTATPPAADLCLVRQVFQHLSNAQVEAALRHLSAFRYLIISEHQPTGVPFRDFQPNTDKPHGPDTRVHDRSGIFLDQPPFNRPVADVLLDVDAGEGREPGRIRSFLLTSPGDA